MANVRTLKLNLLGDVSEFRKSMRTASKDTQSFGDNVKSSLKSVAKSAALAGVAAAGMAIAFGVDAVKAAAADEASQKRLRTSLKNTVKATDAQVKSVEKFILKTSLAKGVVDDKLRPAYQRLVQSTGSMAKSQDLLNLALDVSAGTGKDVETVSNALAKAYDGNFTALKKLGVKIDDNIIKTKDFKAAQQALDDVYKGQAKVKANTFEGKMERFKIAINEAKESIGGLILEKIQPLVDKWMPRIVNAVDNVVAGFSGSKAGKGKPGYTLGQAIRDTADALGNLFSSFTEDANGKTKTFAENLQSIADAVDNIAGAINSLAGAIRKGKQLGQGFWDFLGKLDTANLPFSAENRARDWATNPTAEDPLHQNLPRRRHFMGGGAPVTTVINLNGIVDAESARRSIENLLQQSAIRSGKVNFEAGLL